MTCPNCHKQLEGGKKFCNSCGHSLSDQGRCPRCGSVISLGKKFCNSCGATLPPAVVIAKAKVGGPESLPGQMGRTFASTSAAHATLPSRATVLSVAGVLVLVIAVVGWILWGVELDLVTIPGGATVVVDGRPVGQTVGQAGTLSLPHLSRGTHNMTVLRPEFDEWSGTVNLGWFELSHSIKVTLPVPTYPVAILTDPGNVKVQIDGVDQGISDSSGKLVLPKVARGQHVVTATLTGYPTWSRTLWVASPLSIRSDLAAAAAAAQQEIASRLARAQGLFQQRQYQYAIADCDAVLQLDPANQQAKDLKAQIQQTMSILGAQ